MQLWPSCPWLRGMLLLLAASASVCVQVVARRTVSLAGILGLILGVGMALTSDVVPRLFNPSADVLAALRPVYPFIILTQPLNALAFVLDGVLYGANGFAYAARVSTSSPAHR